MIVGERQVNMRLIAGRNHRVEPRFCPSSQGESGCPRRCVDDTYILQEHAALETRADRL